MTYSSFFYVLSQLSVTKSILGNRVSILFACACAITSLYWFRSTFPFFFETYWILYMLWCTAVGTFFWVLFLIGHDCGHGSFSSNTLINEVMGQLCHGFLLVPFFGWQRSHALHHQYHNHVHKDKSHVHYTEGRFQQLPPLLQWYLRTPVSSVTGFAFYLYAGIQDGCHLWPWSALFSTKQQRIQCVVDDVVLTCFLYLTYTFIGESCFTTWIGRYVIPLLVCHYWLFVITHLQHHHEHTKAYDDHEWTKSKGLLETIDREFGWGLDALFLHITDGHVVHHLSTRIPHYHLKQSSVAFRKELETIDLKSSSYQHKATPLFLFEHTNLRWNYPFF